MTFGSSTVKKVVLTGLNSPRFCQFLTHIVSVLPLFQNCSNTSKI